MLLTRWSLDELIDTLWNVNVAVGATSSTGYAN